MTWLRCSASAALSRGDTNMPRLWQAEAAPTARLDAGQQVDVGRQEGRRLEQAKPRHAEQAVSEQGGVVAPPVEAAVTSVGGGHAWPGEGSRTGPGGRVAWNWPPKLVAGLTAGMYRLADQQARERRSRDLRVARSCGASREGQSVRHLIGRTDGRPAHPVGDELPRKSALRRSATRWLRLVRFDDTVPWHRVVNARGTNGLQRARPRPRSSSASTGSGSCSRRNGQIAFDRRGRIGRGTPGRSAMPLPGWATTACPGTGWSTPAVRSANAVSICWRAWTGSAFCSKRRASCSTGAAALTWTVSGGRHDGEASRAPAGAPRFDRHCRGPRLRRVDRARTGAGRHGAGTRGRRGPLRSGTRGPRLRPGRPRGDEP